MEEDSKINISITDKIFLYVPHQTQVTDKGIEKKYLIVVNRREYLPMNDLIKVSNYNFKHLFDANSGSYLLSILDNNISYYTSREKDKLSMDRKSKNIYFERTINNNTITIGFDKILKSKIKVKLKPITNQRLSRQIEGMIERNIQFGTFDLESFVDQDGISKVYAVGFLTYDYHFLAR